MSIFYTECHSVLTADIVLYSHSKERIAHQYVLLFRCRKNCFGWCFMFHSFISFTLMGLFFVWLGYRVCFKEQITLLHTSRYAKVKDEDKKAFCKASGSGIILIGLSALLCVLVILITASLWGLLFLIPGSAAAIAILVYADRKYNR